MDRRTWFARFLDLTNDIPSDDTFGRVLARSIRRRSKMPLELDPGGAGGHRESLIPIDGKTLRGSYDRRAAGPPFTWSRPGPWENQLSLGQVAVDEKSNEITAIPELLGLLDLTGALVTIDAMGCQKEIAAKIRQRGATTCWPSSRTSRTLYEQVNQAINEALERDQVP